MRRLIGMAAILAVAGFVNGCSSDDPPDTHSCTPQTMLQDCPAASNACAIQTCINSVCGEVPKAAGMSCNFDGGKYCSEKKCVECTSDGHCTGGQVCDKTQNKCITLTDCGNDVINTGEKCDGADLAGETCATKAPTAPLGTLACKTDCKGFDTSGCMPDNCPLDENLGTLTQAWAVMGADDYETQGLINVGLGVTGLNNSTAIFFEIYEGTGFFTGGIGAGTYQLTGAETDYNTCSLCVILQWQNPADENDFMLYMPKSGAVELTALSTEKVAGTMTNMAFAQVVLAEGLPFADPSCKTTIGAMTFTTEVPCPLDENLGTPTQAWSAMGNDDYQTDGLLNIGIGLDSSTAVFFEIYEGGGFFPTEVAAGTYELTGAETSYTTCSLCVIMQWQNPDLENDFMLYMPKSGTVAATTLTQFKFEGTISTMAFAQVKAAAGLPFANPGCKTAIQSMAFSAEVEGSTCGNETVDSFEQCEADDVRGMTCALAGKNGGPVTCNAATCSYDLAACTAPVCGNNTLEPGESCDGTDLGGATCESIGYAAGGDTLTCNSECSLVATTCTAPACSVASDLGTVTPVDSLSFVGQYSVNGYFDLNTEADTVAIEIYPGYGALATDMLPIANKTYTIQGADLDYETCGLCVRIFGQPGQMFMAAGGTFTFSEVPSGPSFKGSMSNVTFKQVTMNPETGATTPVAGGCTTKIDAMSFDTPRY